MKFPHSLCPPPLSLLLSNKPSIHPSSSHPCHRTDPRISSNYFQDCCCAKEILSPFYPSWESCTEINLIVDINYTFHLSLDGLNENKHDINFFRALPACPIVIRKNTKWQIEKKHELVVWQNAKIFHHSQIGRVYFRIDSQSTANVWGGARSEWAQQHQECARFEE